MEVDFPRGPWKRIFNGEWSGTQVHLFKNPDRYTLTAVEDREDGELKGLVLFLNQYFAATGNLSKLNTELGGYSLLMEKNYPTKKGRFFTISTGPEYVKPKTKKVDAKTEEMFHQLKEKEKKLYELSKVHEVDLTDLKNLSEEEESLLFNRPMLLPSLLMSKKEKEKTLPTGKKVLIGKKVDGRKAEENIQTFKATTIIGSKERRKKAFHVLLENCVLSGVNGVIFDDSGNYTDLSSPNSNFPYQKYLDLQPIGLPVKNLKPGEVQIDLNMLDKKSFREVINIEEKEEEYLGQKTMGLIDDIISSGKKLKSLKDIEEELMVVEEDVDKFYRYQGVRWMKVLNQVYPDFFDGKMDLKSMVSSYLQSMGSIIRIDTSALPSNIKMALSYSFLKTLYEENKEEGFKKRLRAIVMFPKGDLYTPAEPGKRIQEKILEVLTDANAYGIGYALGIENEIDIYEPLLNECSIAGKFVSEEEIALTPAEGKSYRSTLRPYLTS